MSAAPPKLRLACDAATPSVVSSVVIREPMDAAAAVAIVVVEPYAACSAVGSATCTANGGVLTLPLVESTSKPRLATPTPPSVALSDVSAAPA